MSAKSLMIQGTSSHAGKSILTTAFCRLFAEDGFRVAPFKSQNMSLNSFVTANGEEIAVAQAVQAEAAGTDLLTEMNPILLKPTEDKKSQVILMGRPVSTMDFYDYDAYKKIAWEAIQKSYQFLASRFDILVIEGAGSPVEMNLKDRDIANMKIAELADAPVIIVTDIDRGGIIASLVGTIDLLEPAERERVIGFVINKFRGERKLLDSAIEFVEKRTGKPVLGVLPFLHDLRILSEDSVSLGVVGAQPAVPLSNPEMLRAQQAVPLQKPRTVKLAIVELPHMANFTDFAPLELENEIELSYVRNAALLDEAHLIILPGSKNTLSDMEYLWKSGMAAKIRSLKGKTPIMGICGGYQMLGREIRDPHHVESEKDSIEGLGLVKASTVMGTEKRTRRVEARALRSSNFFREGQIYSGFEIHMGVTTLAENQEPLLELTGSCAGERDGVFDENGLILGTYLHGIFDNDTLRRDLIRHFSKEASPNPIDFGALKTSEYHRLANLLRENLNLPLIKSLMGL